MQIVKSFETIAKLVITSFVVLLVISCSGYLGAESTAIDYVEAVYNGDRGAFKRLVEEKDLSKTKDYELFIAGKSTARLKTSVLREGLSDIEVISANEKEDKATVKVMVTFGNGQKKKLSVALHKSSVRWYVNPMNWHSW